MSKPNRLFIKVHNAFPEHYKTVELSDKAFRHLIELWCFCSRNLNDGKLTNGQANKYLTKKTRQELVAVGFIDETPDGIQMHDYLDHQQSAQEVADLRERRAEAGSKGGRAKASRLANATGVAKQTASKAVPDTDTDIDADELAGASSSVGTAIALADPPRPDVERICNHLADRIAANGTKRPSIGKTWQDAARLMLDRDGRSEDDIHAAIEWCQSDEFWRSNVLSLPKLREQYDRLRLQAQRGNHFKAKGEIDWDAAFERAAARDAAENSDHRGIA